MRLIPGCFISDAFVTSVSGNGARSPIVARFAVGASNVSVSRDRLSCRHSSGYTFYYDNLRMCEYCSINSSDSTAAAPTSTLTTKSTYWVVYFAS